MKILKKIKKENKENNQKAFVILIAIVVSSFLVSLGMFISNIAYKELLLSSSSKDSQRAFYVADAVMECALRYDMKGGEFKINDADTDTGDFALPCNNFEFAMEVAESEADIASADSVYYISFAEDTGINGILENEEIEAQNNAPYAQLTVEKTNDGTDTILTVYGHNKYKGKGVIERALEVKY